MLEFDNIKIDENFGYFLNKSNLKRNLKYNFFCEIYLFLLAEKIVFLTGGTGLVGRHVIKQLIKSEKSIDLICLVRETKENGKKKLKSKKFYFCSIASIDVFVETRFWH